MNIHDDSNQLFTLAVRFVNHTDKHLFVTGKAGTGKTTFLRYIQEHTCKKMVVVAPTGVAAINAGGVTIHSFFQLPFGPYIASHQNGWDQQQAVTTQHTLLKNIRFNANKRKLLQELDMVIIDEVSMMRCDMLDAIDQILKYFRRKPHIPFGGVQMIFIGDLFQLPPVISNEEWELLKGTYNSPFFFDAHVFRQSPPLYLELKKIYRQSDVSFINTLNNIRNNQATKADLSILNGHFNPSFLPGKSDNYITLTSHNSKADYINRRELEKLQGEGVHFEGEIKGDFSEKALPAEMNLHLKVGAQVMFLKNDKGDKRRFFNGKIATICRIKNDDIFVKFPGEHAEMQLEKETWKNIRYIFNEENNRMDEEEAGTFTQYPVRLAWAITIHKSQGLTFDKAIIDAGASFAAGQVYVALSRLTSLNGLVLYSRIHPDSISTDPRVVAFTRSEKDQDALESILKAEQYVFTNKMLLQSFSWTKIVTSIETLMEAYLTKNLPGKAAAMQWAAEMSEHARNQDAVAGKFSLQLLQLLSTGPGGGINLLLERTLSAEKYFSEQLNIASASLDKHVQEYATLKRVKQYLRDIEKISAQVALKRRELKQAIEMAANLTETNSTNGTISGSATTEKDPSSGLRQVLPHNDRNSEHPPIEAPVHL